jgi:hypothetical protein
MNNHELPFDYSRCQPNTNGCQDKDTCARYTSQWREGYQICTDFTLNSPGKCEHFIPNKAIL